MLKLNMLSKTLGIRGSFKKRRNGFAANTDGAAAIEFAIVAPLAFAMVFSLLEMGTIYTRLSVMDNAIAGVARFVYTGQIENGNVSHDDIRRYVCRRMSPVFPNCYENIAVELTPIESFADLPDTDVTCRDAAVDIEPKVDPIDEGEANDYMFVRVCATINILTPGIGLGMHLSNDRERSRWQLVSSTVFVNEPF